MVNRKIWLVLFVFLPFGLSAQFSDVIRTGRPGQGIGPYVIGKNVFQLQSGVDYYRTRGWSHEPGFKELVHSSIFRLGYTEKLEWNALLNWGYDKRSDGQLKSNLSGTEFGFRVNIIERKASLPALGLQYRLLLPLESKEFRRDHLGSSMTVSTMNRVFDRLNVVTNISLTWTGNAPNPQGGYTLSLSFDASEKLGVFVETYGIMEKFSPWVDGGISYLITPNFQLDFYGGLLSKDVDKEYFFSTGVSYRWLKKAKI